MSNKLALLGLFFALTAAIAAAQPFTYQGFLRDNGSPATGSYNMTFRLYPVNAGGAALATVGPVSVNASNGLFSQDLDFGVVWTGADRYLEIQVGGTILTPRVKINPAPYASFALRPWETLSSNVFYNTGKVGIGTNSPTHSLTVQSSTSETLRLIGPGALYGFSGRINFGDGNFVHLAEDEDDRLAIHANRIALMGGNVGINILNPTAPLHIQSNAIDRALYAHHTGTSGTRYGVLGQSDSPSGIAVHGLSTATTGSTKGVLGRASSTAGIGVHGQAVATSGDTFGVYGEAASANGTGVFGIATSTSGSNYGGKFEARGSGARAVYAEATSTTGFTIGVFGESNSNALGIGVYGYNPVNNGETYGVFGKANSPSGFSVYAEGRFAASGSKSFQIDHPLRPETHYLNHFCFEGPEPQNVYNGAVLLDERGEAWVELPDYFESLNREPRYSLTAIGAPMPNLHIASKVMGNRFKIAGGAPGNEVSWRIEAIRNDRWIQEYGYQTEQEKSQASQGKYLHPELYGQPKEQGIHYRPEPAKPVAIPND